MSPDTAESVRASGNRLEARALLDDSRRRHDTRALAIFAMDGAAYVSCLAAAALFRSLALKLVFATLAALFITRLFVLAHDACHGSYLTSRSLNQLTGRLGFLPSLTAYNLWELGHNTIHHGYTNLKGRDYVWTPFSKSEFDSLPARRQWLERIYRGYLGFGLYYLVEIWWKKMMRPERLAGVPRRVDTRDRLLAAGYGTLWCAGAWIAALATGQSPVLIVFATVLLPFMLWNMVMGFLIYMHHTHPGVAWFNKRSEWRMCPVQVRNAIHVAFPKAIDTLFHNIMDHTAHHVDPMIPLYRLRDAQSLLEAAYRDDVPVQPFSWKYFRTCVAACKLYDYDRHCWLDFDGNITGRVNRSLTVAALMDGIRAATVRERSSFTKGRT